MPHASRMASTSIPVTEIPPPAQQSTLPDANLLAARQAWAEGNRHFAEKNFPAASIAYARGLQHAPHQAPLWFAIGAAASSQHQSRQAIAAFLKALSLQPKFPEALLSLGNELYHSGNFLGAASTYLRAIAQRPRYAKAHCNLGNALSGLRKFREALNCYRIALKYSPRLMAAHHNMGNALLKLHSYAQAEQCFRDALHFHPDSAQLHNSLGNALLKQENFQQAEASYRRAVTMDPNYSAAHTNLANALLDLRRFAEMDHHYRRAIQLDPVSAGGQYNLALACLRAGNFAEGWQRYHWRWQFRDLNMQPRNFPQPQLTREILLADNLTGKTILLHAEQGMGDTLQFVRYLPLLAAHGVNIILEVQPRLLPLLSAEENSRALGASLVLAKGSSLPRFDLHCPLMSLPAVFATTLQNLPAATPYLHAPASRIAAAWKKFPRTHALRIGLNWQGNLQSRSNLRRSTTLQTFLPLLQIHGAQFFSLQHGADAGQIHAACLTDACSTDASFADAAAVIATLDLIITVDTSIAHLAAAMHRPTWILLPYRADWRWMEDATRTPWYPTAQIYRQPAPNAWPDLLKIVHHDVQQKIYAGSGSIAVCGDHRYTTSSRV